MPWAIRRGSRARSSARRRRLSCPRITSSRAASTPAHVATVTVELGVEVVDVADGPDAVRVALRDVTTGATRFVEADYVVGADGAYSAVRRSVGMPMHGSDRLATTTTALFRAPLWELLGDYRYGIYGVDHAEARAPSCRQVTATGGCSGSTLP